MAYTTINKSTLFMNNNLHTGTGASQAITGVGFQPDLSWFKKRDGTTEHQLYDAVRTATKVISSQSTDTEWTESTGLTSFDSDGYTLGGASGTNGSSNTYASWSWKANGAGSSNSDGSITSTVSANTTAGFSIVKYSGDPNANTTIGHGLGAVPKLIITKCLTTTHNWGVYHHSLGVDKYLRLNTTDSEQSSSGAWGSTPTSSVFGVGGLNENDQASQDYIAYCFAEKTGYSKFGSYTGNGADQQFIYTGFAPKFLIFKGISNTSNWILFDDKRLTYNATYGRDRMLFPVDNSAEQDNSSDGGVDMLSNGFCFRGTASMTGTTELNESGATYMYMAFGQTMVGTNNIPATGR